MLATRCLRSARASYDYIIVGGGSAGCVLANRLSALPGAKVLLLEAGSPDSSPIFRVPLASVMYGTIFSKKYNWSCFSEPEVYLNSRHIYQPRGRVLGGSGSINGMIWVRGHPEDYNGWAKLSGDASWEYESLLPYFKKSEHASSLYEAGSDPAADRCLSRGEGGPMHVEPTRWRHPISVAFLAACGQAGLKEAMDFNSGSNTEGYGFYEMTQKKGRRMSTRSSYLPTELVTQRASTKQLTVVTDALVHNIEIEKGRAVGVRYSRDNETHIAQADREIVVSSGVFNSPQLLMLSGIGPAMHLQDMDIPVKVDLPAVGQNLQDHLDVGVTFANPTRESLGLSPWGILQNISAPFDYIRGHGLLTGNGVNAGGYIKSSSDQPYEDLQLHFFPGSFREYKLSSLLSHSFSCNVYLSRPKSRGTVRLQSTDPATQMQLNFNYLADEEDRRALIGGVRRVRHILNQEALDRYRGKELHSGSAQTDEELLEFLRANCKSAHHPTGTCSMGKNGDTNAVVDSALRVQGIEGLRVADASVMPTIPTSNPYSSVIAVAEKCADMMLNQE